MRLFIGAAVLALAACASTVAVINPGPVKQLAAAGVTPEALRAISAMCGAEVNVGLTPPADLKRDGGVGTGGFKVDSDNADAQAWFDYGLALSHAFYHEDAKTAMKKAVEADPKCSLCAWGQAWVLGPTLNYGINEGQRLEALKAAHQARSLAKPGDEKARRLAEAIIARYAADKKTTEPAFGQDMLAIAEAYPDDLELSVLAAHTLLIPVRDDDERGLKPALKLLDRVLAKKPDDTGAIHYYIHATEFDGRAEDAIKYAERLGPLAPKASHLVHMPAHTFFHAGRYEEAALVNANAIGADGDWIKAGGAKRATGLPMYYAHNVTFGLAGSLMAGDAELALRYQAHTEKMWPSSLAEGMRAYPVPRSWVALARYAPDKALALPKPTEKDGRFTSYWHYARGEALLVRGDVAAAKLEQQALAKTKDIAKGAEGQMMRDVLAGRIAMAEGRAADAARVFAGAAKRQEKDLTGYMDPPSWWYPVRRSVAAAYLKAGDFKRAEAEAEASLKGWKNDPLALWVLGNAQLGLGHLGQGEATIGEARDRCHGDFDSITVDAI
jgi:tetratricopeptide (TPR) repeat protein